MNKLKVFEKELNYIKNGNIRNFTEQTLLQLPEYFWTVPASSSGKYHPKFSLGNGGLIKHVQVAVTIAMDLMQLEMMSAYTDIHKDVVIASLLIHDGLKYGKELLPYTVTEHPLLIAEFITNNSSLNTLVDENVLNVIVGCVKSHMGEWNADYKTKKQIMPKPSNKLEHFVHMCDYLSSRKYFEEFNFDVNVVR